MNERHLLKVLKSMSVLSVNSIELIKRRQVSVYETPCIVPECPNSIPAEELGFKLIKSIMVGVDLIPLWDKELDELLKGINFDRGTVNLATYANVTLKDGKGKYITRFKCRFASVENEGFNSSDFINIDRILNTILHKKYPGKSLTDKRDRELRKAYDRVYTRFAFNKEELLSVLKIDRPDAKATIEEV